MWSTKQEKHISKNIWLANGREEYMVQGLLLILKIVGVIILSIFVIILLMSIAVLFVPVRYGLIAKKRAGFFAKVKVTWLLHMVTATILYQDELTTVIKIFGIPVYKSKKDKSKIVKEAQEDILKESKNIVIEAEENVLKESKHIEKEAEKEVNKESKYIVKEAQEEVNKDLKHIEKEAEKDTNTESNHIQDNVQMDNKKKFEHSKSIHWSLKKLNFIRRIKVFFLKWIGYFKKKCLEVKLVTTNITYYIDVWNSESFREFRILIKKKLFRIWKMIKPKKFKVWLHVGMGDPADTGGILVWYSMLYPILGQNIEIQPEFEEEVFEFEATATGKITIAVLFIIALKIYFDKNLKKLIVLLKKENK